MAKYGKAASKTVRSAMRRRKSGTLKSGSGRTVRSRKQAIAIGLSEARSKGAKVPRRTSARTTARKSSRSSRTSKEALTHSRVFAAVSVPGWGGCFR